MTKKEKTELKSLYAVLKQDIKTRRTELISVHWYCYEAEHIADIEFNSLCLDEQAKYNYLVCGVTFRNMCYQKGDTPRECFDRASAAPVNKYCLYYTVYKVFSLKGLKKKMKFLKFFMYVCAVLAFLSFFVMMAGTGEGEGAKLIMLIGLLAFVFFASAAQMLKNHMEWKEKQREREAVKRYIKDIERRCKR